MPTAPSVVSRVLALDADFAVRGPGGERTIAAADFFQGFLETALADDEPLAVVPLRRPVILVLAEKAEVIEGAGAHTISLHSFSKGYGMADMAQSPAITPNSAAATPQPRSLCGCSDSSTESR